MTPNPDVVNPVSWDLLTYLIGLLVAFLGLSFAGGKLLLGQFEKRLDERFAAQQQGREATQKHWDAQFDGLKAGLAEESRNMKASLAEESRHWQNVERDLMNLKAELPLAYVRRDDYIRNQSVIEAKIDGLALRIENALLKGAANNG